MLVGGTVIATRPQSRLIKVFLRSEYGITNYVALASPVSGACPLAERIR